MRLIDADALELILSNAIEMMRTMAKALDSEDDPEIQMEIKAYTDILDGVKEQSTIEERKTGRWMRIDKTKVKCSNCEITHLIAQYPHGCIDYCPNCGAKMESEVEE